MKECMRSAGKGEWWSSNGNPRLTERLGYGNHTGQHGLHSLVGIWSSPEKSELTLDFRLCWLSPYDFFVKKFCMCSITRPVIKEHQRLKIENIPREWSIARPVKACHAFLSDASSSSAARRRWSGPGTQDERPMTGAGSSPPLRRARLRGGRKATASRDTRTPRGGRRT
jgi:hypothetical protein